LLKPEEREIGKSLFDIHSRDNLDDRRKNGSLIDEDFARKGSRGGTLIKLLDE